MKTITNTDFKFKSQTNFYRGKVRDVYTIADDKVLMITTDRISAFDVILPKPIPYKGEILNTIAKMFLKSTEDIIPNWLLETPHPNVSIGKLCKPFKVEMVVRGYLAGHSARLYNSGCRNICGVELPDGLVEGDKLPFPIITPTTKADSGHDIDISRDEIIKSGLVQKEMYEKLEDISIKLFNRGSKLALDMGLILVDTKYEFGLYNNELYLIDEIHTPDSSRYFIKNGYLERQSDGKKQKQLSKEFVREWLISQGFQGNIEDKMPEFTDEIVSQISKRYIELYEALTGKKFESKAPDIFESLTNYLDINQ